MKANKKEPDQIKNCNEGLYFIKFYKDTLRLHFNTVSHNCLYTL